MAKNQRDGKVKKLNQGRLIFMVIIAVLIIAIIVIIKNIVTLKIEEGRLTSQEKELQGKKEELTAELQGVDELDYIEEQARKLLKMIKPGEVLYILNGEDPRPEGSSTPTSIDPSLIPPPAVTTEEEPEYTEEYVEEEYSEYTEEETAPEETSEETTEEVISEETSWEEETSEETYEEEGDGDSGE